MKSNSDITVLCLHGPNLNLLGQREPEIYGTDTLDDVNSALQRLAEELSVTLECRQSNREGELIDWIQQARGNTTGLVFNPGGYTHTSVALRDAVIATQLPCVEVHLSNVYQRETFRHRSLFADISVGKVVGFGTHSYLLGLRGLIAHLRHLQRAPAKSAAHKTTTPLKT